MFRSIKKRGESIKNKFPDMEKLNKLIKRYDFTEPELTKVFFSYMLAHQKTTGKIDSYLSRFEVTSTQISILLLLVISENGFETPGSISKKLGLSNPTISNVTKTLNKKKLVKKEASKKDKRFCNIYITSQGLTFLNKIMPEYHLKYERLLTNFNDEELKYLKHNSLKLFCSLDFF